MIKWTLSERALTDRPRDGKSRKLVNNIVLESGEGDYFKRHGMRCNSSISCAIEGTKLLDCSSGGEATAIRFTLFGGQPKLTAIIS